MIGIVSYPHQFDNDLIKAIEAEPCQEIDQKIYSIVVEKNLFGFFTSWTVHNRQWLKAHPKLVHDLTMLSFSKGDISNVELLETLGSFGSVLLRNRFIAMRCLQGKELLKNELKIAIETGNKLLVCSVLFTYLDQLVLDSPGFIKRALNELNGDEKAAFINLKNGFGYNFLHICAQHNKTQAFDLMLEIIPESQRTRALDSKTSEGIDVLGVAIASNHSLILKKIMEVFPKTERASKVTAVWTQSKRIRKAMLHSEEVMSELIKVIPANERVKVLKTRDSPTGDSLLDLAFRKYFHNIIEKFFILTPPKQRLSLIKDISPRLYGSPPLHYAAAVGNFAIVKAVWSLLSDKDQAIVRTIRDTFGRTLLHSAVIKGGPSLIKLVLPSKLKEKTAYIQLGDLERKTALHRAVLTKNKAAMKILLNVMSVEERETSLNLTDLNGRSVIDCVLAKTSLHKIVLKRVSLSYQKNLGEKVERLIKDRPQISYKILNSLSEIIPDQIRHLLPNFKVYYQYNDAKNLICLLGRDREFVEKKWEVITNYTLKIDPQAKISGPKIKKVLSEEDLKHQFTHYISAHKILPYPVRAWYGLGSMQSERNCHGAALVAAGISSVMSGLSSPHSFAELDQATQKIPIEDISSGDWVFLKQGPKGSRWQGIQGAHSFVFLDHELCLSMNGYDQQLEFHPTGAVLKLYGYPEDILKPDNQSKERKHITIYRKNPQWFYSKEEEQSF